MKFICINSVCHKIYNGESGTLTRSWVFFTLTLSVLSSLLRMVHMSNED